MKTQLQSPKFLAGAATLLFVLSMVGTGIFYNKSESLSELLAGEKALTEKLTLEKNELLNEIQIHKNDLQQIKRDKKEVDNMLSMANEKLNQKEAAVNKMSRDNKNLKGQLSELQTMREQMNKEMSQLKLTIQMLQDENSKLSQANANLLSEIKELKDKLKLTAARANNFKVEVFRKRKDKLTVSAKKSHTVSVSFDHNLSSLASLGEQNVFLVMKDKNGKVLKSGKSGQASVIIDGKQKDIEYTTAESLDGGSNMSIRFDPEDELGAEVYAVDVYNQDNYLGGVKFRLTK